MSHSELIRVGIFFGGASREREISFAGGRTVYDNLNKSLFEAVPIFVDSLGRFILLNWEYLYKGTIRDFYPPFEALPDSAHGFQVYMESLEQSAHNAEAFDAIGKRIEPSDFKNHFDIAFLALHGPYGEDGNIQGVLEWYGLPYTGSGILPSAIGIDKKLQKALMQQAGFPGPNYTFVSKEDWFSFSPEQKGHRFQSIINELGWPMVIKSPHQGSSIGISVLAEDTLEAFEKALHKSFFIDVIQFEEWTNYSEIEKQRRLSVLTDIREGIGFPVLDQAGNRYLHPEALWSALDRHFLSTNEPLTLEAEDTEAFALIEAFVKGQEFSCIVIQDLEGKAVALPPTGIIKGKELFDYRSKYLPGMSRKVTPIDLPENEIERIREACEKLFYALQFDVYARIDGFYGADGRVFLNDPNTTSGMLPSSFFFHQAAEIGLNPSQFLTYILHRSLTQRLLNGKQNRKVRSLINRLERALEAQQSADAHKQKVAVIMGGYSSERHISMESGRNIYEKLASSSTYLPIPVFLTGNSEALELFVLPTSVLLKDNADDIRDKVKSVWKVHPSVAAIKEKCQPITKQFVGSYIERPQPITFEALSQEVDAVFIALHGRPGEDGQVQAELERLGLPYNGSRTESAAQTIDKFLTNEKLAAAGILVAAHRLVTQQDYEALGEEGLLTTLLSSFSFPLIAKPSDDGCSSAVKKIRNVEELRAYIRLMFGFDDLRHSASTKVLGLKENEEFPLKHYFVVEELIERKGAKHFIEVTGGMLSRYNEKGELIFEVFEPSEALATGDVLSLEEKFLAGEGQNITPARYSKNKAEYKIVADQVKATLEKTARVMGVEGYCRIDAFVRVFDDLSVETIIIEINSLPGMTPATCIFHQTALNGYKPFDFIDQILNFGIARNKRTQFA